MLKLIPITICFLAFVLAAAASAETITVVGFDGQPGQPGGSAEAVANAPDEQNVANATGGEGDGAPGGSALAVATTTEASGAFARAEGGRGRLAEGGAAIAQADNTNSQGEGNSTARATGGSSAVGSPGAVATATASMVSTGGGKAEARADSGGIANADATANAESSGDGASLTAIATAEAFGGVASSQATGLATGDRAVIVEAFSDGTTLAGLTEASGSNAGSSPVSVSVTAIGKIGARATVAGEKAQDGHTVAATLSGTSAGGGAVSLSTTLIGGKGGGGTNGADGGDGADVLVTVADIGTGSTTGPLSIEVTAASGFGGGAPQGTPGNFGKVSANLDVTHAGGDLDLDVELNGSLESSQLMGRSSSGADVSVALTVLHRDAPFGLDDAVDAETTGAVKLRQVAISQATNFGDGDDVTSELSRAKSVPSLELFGSASAGESTTAIGGAGSSTVEATNSAGAATATASAGGGDGISRRDGARGGMADAVARATATGGGPATANAGASGGDGELGGEASSVAWAISEGDGEVQAHATSTTTSTDQVAARASAMAFGRNAGSGPVSVSAEARANSEHFLATNSVLEVSARGESTGGADVEVSATGRGAEIRNAVSGSTTGRLTLVQDLVNNPSAGISLIASNEGGGDLSVSVSVDSVLDTVFLGDIVAVSTTGADVDLHVSASSDEGIFLLNPDFTQPDIRAESNGGDVSVSTFFETERVDAVADSLVSVSTTGAISIEQEVKALTSNAASSFLTHAVDSQSLDLIADAEGGTASSTGRTGADGGDAEARINMRNESGTGTGMALARGGDGGQSETSNPGDGGDALAEVVATTVADGQALLVGDASESGLGGAIGGRGGERLSMGTYGSGGNAVSSSTGTALGVSSVSVYDFAQGGSAFIAESSGGVGAGGGDASSIARSEGTSAPVVAHSLALGGQAGAGQPSDALDGGDAVSVALASGLGAVDALARAEGGASLRGAIGGRASAIAMATGASGEAVAEAVSHQVGIEALRTFSRSAVASSATSLAESGSGLARLAFSQDIAAAAFLTSAPLSADIELALQDNSGLAQLIEQDLSIVALGQWFGASESSPRSVHGELDITLEAPEGAWLGAFDFVSVGAGFLELSIAIELGGTPFEEHFFDDPALAIAFFQDRLFDLGPLMSEAGSSAAATGEPAPSVRFVYDMTMAAGDAFGMSLGLVVPEPNTGLMLAVGLLLLARRGRDGTIARLPAAVSIRR